MHKRTATIAAIAASIIVLFSPPSTADGDSEVLRSAVDRHRNAAPDADHELALVAELTELSAKNAEAWLPDFWAAYLLTQITMSHEEDRGARLDKAQAHLDRARQRAADHSSAPDADLHALQSLIYVFVLSGIEKDDRDNWNRVNAQIDAELEKAFELDPKSPVVMVMAGTKIIREGQAEKSWPKVMGGLALLNQAKQLFESSGEPRGLTTHFNSEWIAPWSGWVSSMYEDGFGSE